MSGGSLLNILILPGVGTKSSQTLSEDPLATDCRLEVRSTVRDSSAPKWNGLRADRLYQAHCSR